ncbi:hypothetical protein PN36_06745 [Candidatus Thiomargarita nelsonii]|uniref:ATPase AAA-type core domain-containing protein n=1 Tax=Candidatus Thiomargarita nelsonii TaxID=1003181 RepID=A0A4E0QWQ5_9GAMM|nr:hypothetical protein PN36_06745 [Candidatus Thiomargarita nelsonii]
MTTGTISYLKIANYRSIDVLELHEIKPFSVFAGPNGAGKSNFFQALDFVNLVIRFGTEEALKQHGGFENIRCWRRHETEARTFEFEIDFSTENADCHRYQLKIHQMDNVSSLEEQFQWLDEEGKMQKIHRVPGENPVALPSNFSMLLILFNHTAMAQFLKNIRFYRIDPIKARMPVKNTDTSELSHDGRNLAGVLHRLGKDDEISETIEEWMNIMVPSLEKISTDWDQLDGSVRLAFQEHALEKRFPASMISEGTINLLSILVALFDRPLPFGISLIDEPESSLHPKAVIELVDSFREIATRSSPIWVTTHHDSLVRVLKNSELWLVDKKTDVTSMKPVPMVDKLSSPLDQAWLCNVLGGGLP